MGLKYLIGIESYFTCIGFGSWIIRGDYVSDRNVR